MSLDRFADADPYVRSELEAPYRPLHSSSSAAFVLVPERLVLQTITYRGSREDVEVVGSLHRCDARLTDSVMEKRDELDQQQNNFEVYVFKYLKIVRS